MVFILAAMILAGCGEVTNEVTSADENRKPNILLLVADDTAFGDVGAYGSEVHTPNLNKISDVGISFTNFHVSPVCSVTRSMLFTGNDNT